MTNYIVDIVENSQYEYLEKKDKNYLKNTSQFFTPYDTACKMISTINFKSFINYDTLYILEPSAGCGILIVSLMLHILENCNSIKKVHIDTYENDCDVSNILCNN